MASEGDVIGGRFELGGLVAYQGKDGCQDWQCTRIGSVYDPLGGKHDLGECAGWHCSHCHEPSSMYGHAACQKNAERGGSNG